MSNTEHRSRYAEKKRRNPSPNAMHAIAELGEDGIWRVDGQPYRAPKKVRYVGQEKGCDVFVDQVTGERVW